MAARRKRKGKPGEAARKPATTDRPMQVRRRPEPARAAISREDGVEGSAHPARLRFVVVSLALMALGYGAFYFPYAPGSFVPRAIERYLELQAAASGWLIRLSDPVVAVSGSEIHGRFSLLVAKNCSSLEVQALFAAAVVAYPARAPQKLLGLGAGIALLTALNVARIATLYFVGANHPVSFDAVHEELLPLVLILSACGAFAVWAHWSGRPGIRAAI